MQEQTTKKQANAKTSSNKGIPVVGVAGQTPPSADALREAHMNLIRAEQNLYSLIQADPASSAQFGTQQGFGNPAAFATQTGYEAPGFDAGIAHQAATPGYPGISNGMIANLSSVGTNPAVSPWAPGTSALPAGQFTAPSASWAGRPSASATQGQSSIGRTLACDIIDEGNQLVCQFELPGIEADQIEVLCFGSAITVNAYREPEGEILNLVQSERATATQQRVVRLPSQVQPSEVTATLANGVLTIALPKLHPTEGPRLVEIQS